VGTDRGGKKITLVKRQIVDHHIRIFSIEFNIKFGIDNIDHFPNLNSIQLYEGVFEHGLII
jgi:hypothetical protein